MKLPLQNKFGWLKHKKIIVLLVLPWAFLLVGSVKNMPPDFDFAGQEHPVTAIDFIYDLSYEEENEMVREKRIFPTIYEMIKSADEFVILDMFLFNDAYDETNVFYDHLANDLSDVLLEAKREKPELKILVITDEINTFYGNYEPEHFQKLKKAGLEVVLTKLDALPDSNKFYSGIWRTLFSWIDTGGTGWLPNAFSEELPDVSLRGYLKLLNFKANHRKVVITDKEALISSANPHAASSNHANIAFKVRGPVLLDLLQAEKAVVELSNKEWPLQETLIYEDPKDYLADIRVSLLTEEAIYKSLQEAIGATQAGDKIQMAMFYLSERNIISSLLQASARGVSVQLILDANQDAFGREKNGIPNRQVASELWQESEGKINIRWYKTHGEQFHSKLTKIDYFDHCLIFGGSANLTRRNIRNYNLEADILVKTGLQNKTFQEVDDYFTMLWTKSEYTVPLEDFYEDQRSKYFLYLIQEYTGISSF